MGLDIRAYQNLEYVGPADKNDPYGEGLSLFEVKTYNHYDFGNREGSMRIDHVYRGDAFTSQRMGSYSGYSRFRDTLWLCAMRIVVVAKTVEKHAPGSIGKFYGLTEVFEELIDFSDCEGIIGPEACKRIYGDLVSWRATCFHMIQSDCRAKIENVGESYLLAHPEFKESVESEFLYFMAAYDRAVAVFAAASENGCAVFC